MSELYGAQQLKLQHEFGTEGLAAREKELIVAHEISDMDKGFIESRDMFFLTTVDHRGYPTCSHKGGAPGFMKVLDNKTIAFPSYNGNGMFMSLGNILEHSKVGLLLIDFETPHRIRIHGEATIDRQDPLLAEFIGAEVVVRVEVSEIFINCPRYIHRFKKAETSKYVPTEQNLNPPTPHWKRIDAIQDVLPQKDLEKVADLGTITLDQYGELLQKGEG